MNSKIMPQDERNNKMLLPLEPMIGSLGISPESVHKGYVEILTVTPSRKKMMPTAVQHHHHRHKLDFQTRTCTPRNQEAIHGNPLAAPPERPYVAQQDPEGVDNGRQTPWRWAPQRRRLSSTLNSAKERTLNADGATGRHRRPAAGRRRCSHGSLFCIGACLFTSRRAGVLHLSILGSGETLEV